MLYHIYATYIYHYITYIPIDAYTYTLPRPISCVSICTFVLVQRQYLQFCISKASKLIPAPPTQLRQYVHIKKIKYIKYINFR
jgi:hypothetical protein